MPIVTPLLSLTLSGSSNVFKTSVLTNVLAGIFTSLITRFSALSAEPHNFGSKPPKNIELNSLSSVAFPAVAMFNPALTISKP